MSGITKLILGLIPNEKCNLKCEYCYISQVEAWDEPTPLEYSVEHISKALSKERLGGTSLINLTGNGETMLQPDIVNLIEALLNEGHFVEVVTNGTIKKHILQVLNFNSENLSRLFFKISFHYKELKRLNLISNFFENVIAIQNSPASFTLELMAYDDIEEDIDEIVSLCLDNVGAVCHATIGRDDKRKDKGLLSSHSETEFKEIWSKLESPMTDFKLEIINKKRREFCYAGAWSLFVNMYTGESQPCYWQPYTQNVFNNIEKPIDFTPVGHTCTQPYCTNGHAHMCWGIIPKLDTPTYEDMRNRISDNGKHWIKGECKTFFQSKLYDQNQEFGTVEKFVHNGLYPFKLSKWFIRDFGNNMGRIKKYLGRVSK